MRYPFQYANWGRFKNGASGSVDPAEWQGDALRHQVHLLGAHIEAFLQATLRAGSIAES